MSQKNYKITLTPEEVILLAKTVFRVTVLPKPPFDEKLLPALKTALEVLQTVPKEELDKHDEVMYSMSRREVMALKELCLERVHGVHNFIIPKYKDMPDMLANANKLKDGFSGIITKLTVQGRKGKARDPK